MDDSLSHLAHEDLGNIEDDWAILESRSSTNSHASRDKKKAKVVPVRENQARNDSDVKVVPMGPGSQTIIFEQPKNQSKASDLHILYKLSFTNVVKDAPTTLYRSQKPNVLFKPWDAIHRDHTLVATLKEIFQLAARHIAERPPGMVGDPLHNSTIWTITAQSVDDASPPYMKHIKERLCGLACPVVPGHSTGTINHSQSIEYMHTLSQKDWLAAGNINAMVSLFNMVVCGEILLGPNRVGKLTTRFLPKIQPRLKKRPIVFFPCNIFASLLPESETISEAIKKHGNTLMSRIKYDQFERHVWLLSTAENGLTPSGRPARKAAAVKKHSDWCDLADMFVFPCNIDNEHWVTVVVDLRQKDSPIIKLYNGANKIGANKIIEAIFLNLLDPPRHANSCLRHPTIRKDHEYPWQKQDDAWSCGHRSILTMWYFLVETGYPGITEEDMQSMWKGILEPDFRYWIAVSTFNASLWLPGQVLGSEIILPYDQK